MTNSLGYSKYLQTNQIQVVKREEFIIWEFHFTILYDRCRTQWIQTALNTWNSSMLGIREEGS